MYRFDRESYRLYDDGNIATYAVLRTEAEAAFRLPFDSIFTENNTLAGYQPIFAPLAFRSYVKSSWSNVRPEALDKVLTDIGRHSPRYRSWIPRLIDRMGAWH